MHRYLRYHSRCDMHNHVAGGKSRRIDTCRTLEAGQEENNGDCKLLAKGKVVLWLAVRD
jgi:hypothetical protein